MENVVKFPNSNRKERPPITYREYMNRQEQRIFDINRTYEKTSDEERGHKAEEMVLGKCSISAGEPIKLDATRSERMQFVREHQPQEQTVYLQVIRKEIEKRVGNSISAFTAVGSPLDFENGIDAFFESEEGFVFTMDYGSGSSKKNIELGEGAVLAFDPRLPASKQAQAINAYIDDAVEQFQFLQEQKERKYAP